VVDLVVVAADVHIPGPPETGAAKRGGRTGIADHREDPIMVGLDLAERLVAYADHPLPTGEQLIDQCAGKRRVAADDGVATSQPRPDAPDLAGQKDTRRLDDGGQGEQRREEPGDLQLPRKRAAILERLRAEDEQLQREVGDVEPVVALRLLAVEISRDSEIAQPERGPADQHEQESQKRNVRATSRFRRRHAHLRRAIHDRRKRLQLAMVDSEMTDLGKSQESDRLPGYDPKGRRNQTGDRLTRRRRGTEPGRCYS
jgi:hypothetical protein